MGGKTRTRLLQAAEKILVEQGVQALSVRRVGEVSELNPTLITYHFGSVSGLLEELCDRNLELLLETWDELAGPLPPSDDPLGLVLQRWIEPLYYPAAFNPTGRALVVIDEIAAHGDGELSAKIIDKMIGVAANVGRKLEPLLHNLTYEEVRDRMRFIAGASLGPPPRDRTQPVASGKQTAEEMSASLIAFARAALSNK